MFSFYRNGIPNHVWFDKKEDFVVPGTKDIYARKILIYVRKKDVKYTTMSSKWVLIVIFLIFDVFWGNGNRTEFFP